MHVKYDVIEPPTVGDLVREINVAPSQHLSQLALKLVVRESATDINRSSSHPDMGMTFNVDAMIFGGTPHLTGHINGEETQTASMDVISDGSNDDVEETDSRRLTLSVYYPE